MITRAWQFPRLTDGERERERGSGGAAAAAAAGAHQDRALGVLLGSVANGVVEVSNCFGVLHVQQESEVRARSVGRARERAHACGAWVPRAIVCGACVPEAHA
jgi:hypothetical protein